jgi:hypothetical protein
LELVNFLGQCGPVYVPQLTVFLATSGFQYSSDQASFGELGYQASESVEYDATQWNPYYHSTGDLPSTLDYTFLAYCTQLNLAAAMELAGYLGIREEPEPQPPQGNPYIYPNPLRMSSGTRNLTFANLSPGTGIKIYDLSGNLVWETQAQNATLVWESNLASGVYLYRIKKDNAQFIGKIAVIR